MTEEYANLRVLQNDKAGKGLAVQRGMLEAKGEYRIFCDADLSMPIEEVRRFIPPNLSPTACCRSTPGPQQTQAGPVALLRMDVSSGVCNS